MPSRQANDTVETGASSSAALNRPEDSASKSSLKNFEETTVLLAEDDHMRAEGDDLEFPEGGAHAWTVVFGSFIGLVPTWGLYYSNGIIQTYIASNQLADVPTSTISWIFSIFNFFFLSASVLSGLYFDRNGARKPALVGAIMVVAGIMCAGNCKTVVQFILGFSCLCGIGGGIVTSPLVGSVCHYFLKKRAIASAVAINGGSVGGVVIPLMLRSLFGKVGYAWAMRILGFMSIGCYIVALALVKEAHRSQEPIKGSIFKYYATQSFDFSALKDTKFLFTILGCTFAELSTTIGLTYFPLYCTKRGFSDAKVFLFVTVLNAIGIPGGYFPSIVADHFLGRFNVLILVLVITSLLNLVIWLPFGYSEKALWAYCGLYGFFFGSILSLIPVCCGQVSRTDQFGRRYSTMYFVCSVAILAGIPVAGAIIGDESIHNYNSFIGFVSACGLTGALFYMMCKITVLGPKGVFRVF